MRIAQGYSVGFVAYERRVPKGRLTAATSAVPSGLGTLRHHTQGCSLGLFSRVPPGADDSRGSFRETRAWLPWMASDGNEERILHVVNACREVF